MDPEAQKTSLEKGKGKQPSGFAQYRKDFQDLLIEWDQLTQVEQLAFELSQEEQQNLKD